MAKRRKKRRKRKRKKKRRKSTTRKRKRRNKDKVEFRPSTLQERKEYYTDFSMEKVKEWFPENNLSLPQLYAVDMGSETKIIKNKEKLDKITILRPDNLKQKLLNYLPEDVYYDRNRYHAPEKAINEMNFKFSSPNFRGQELVFDVDSDNISCECDSEYPNFCEKCLQKSISQGVKLAEYLQEKFDQISLVYSGRGTHVHVADKEAFNLTQKERKEIVNEVKKFNIDPWVSQGNIRLIRLPFSLNALVSRIVLPLDLEEARGFNPLQTEKTLPNFMK